MDSQAAAWPDDSWADEYKRNLRDLVHERGRGKRIPHSLKMSAVGYFKRRKAQDHWTLSEVSRELGLPPPTLRRWVLDFGNGEARTAPCERCRHFDAITVGQILRNIEQMTERHA